MMKSTFLLFGSMMALATGLPARAGPMPQSAPGNQPANDASSAPVASEGLTDIIVTAQRVSESAQRAPIAISVVNADDLVQQAVTRPEDLSRLVPALVANSAGGSYTTFSLRGVGNSTLNAYSDPAIAFNYDGVYIARPSSTGGTFYDLQRVEVLKGPQGTLYGRNATGGAINVIPNRPKPGANTAEAVVSYGNYNAVIGQAALNFAVGDRGAVRLSGNVTNDDPYYNDGTYNQDEYGFRGQIYADLTADFNVRVAADYARMARSCPRRSAADMGWECPSIMTSSSKAVIGSRPHRTFTDRPALERSLRVRSSVAIRLPRAIR